MSPLPLLGTLALLPAMLGPLEPGRAAEPSATGLVERSEQALAASDSIRMADAL